MNFSDALILLKDGTRIQRSGWNGKGMFLLLVKAEDYLITGFDYEFNKTDYNLPFILMFTADKKIVPWLASQTDILANDWIVYTEV